MTLDELKSAVANLPEDELSRFRAWFAEFDSKYEPETTAHKLGRLAGRAFADFRKRSQEKS